MKNPLLSPGKMIAIGFVLVLLGAALPFLMVLRIIEPTFLLIFMAFGASMGGLLLGFVGAAYIVIVNRSRSADRFDKYIHQYRDDKEPEE
ncbi:MAG: hypothetical protein ROW52_11420 [Anaerolineaceae bacterium]|jgi:hypothetical protein